MSSRESPCVSLGSQKPSILRFPNLLGPLGYGLSGLELRSHVGFIRQRVTLDATVNMSDRSSEDPGHELYLKSLKQ